MQSTVGLLSTLSGSIVGIMGISGFIMNLFENNYLKYKRKRENKLNLLMLIGQRKIIQIKNFLMDFNKPKLNVTGNNRGTIYTNDRINSYFGESISTFRCDDPMNYKVEGLDIP